jgi:hypothetical protein
MVEYDSIYFCSSSSEVDFKDLLTILHVYGILVLEVDDIIPVIEFKVLVDGNPIASTLLVDVIPLPELVGLHQDVESPEVLSMELSL